MHRSQERPGQLIFEGEDFPPVSSSETTESNLLQPEIPQNFEGQRLDTLQTELNCLSVIASENLSKGNIEKSKRELGDLFKQGKTLYSREAIDITRAIKKSQRAIQVRQFQTVELVGEINNIPTRMVPSEKKGEVPHITAANPDETEKLRQKVNKFRKEYGTDPNAKENRKQRRKELKEEIAKVRQVMRKNRNK